MNLIQQDRTLHRYDPSCPACRGCPIAFIAFGLEVKGQLPDRPDALILKAARSSLELDLSYL